LKERVGLKEEEIFVKSTSLRGSPLVLTADPEEEDYIMWTQTATPEGVHLRMQRAIWNNPLASD
jgi:hypothetical protein